MRYKSEIMRYKEHTVSFDFSSMRFFIFLPDLKYLPVRK